MSGIKAAEKQTELCALNGKTYVTVEDTDGNVNLAEKSAKGGLLIISGATHTAGELRVLMSKIKAATPAVKVINDQVEAKIRERYSVADEIKMLRIAPSPESDAWNDYVEDCREWGREEKAKLGL